MINELIAKSAIEKKLSEIINPVISDMGFELVRLRLMSNKEITLQIMAARPSGYINVDECAEISTALRHTFQGFFKVFKNFPCRFSKIRVVSLQLFYWEMVRSLESVLDTHNTHFECDQWILLKDTPPLRALFPKLKGGIF